MDASHTCEPSHEKTKTINGKLWTLCEYCATPLSFIPISGETQAVGAKKIAQTTSQSNARTQSVPSIRAKRHSKHLAPHSVSPVDLAWIEKHSGNLGISGTYEANQILKQLDKPFMHEHRLEECGEVLDLKFPFFEEDPKYVRELDTMFFNGTPRLWQEWRTNERKIAERLSPFPPIQQRAVREILRMRREQQHNYTARTSQRIEKFLETFIEERKRIVDLREVLGKPSLFKQDLTDRLVEYCDSVTHQLDQAEVVVREAEKRLTDAMTVTKKSALRKELHSALVNIIASVPGVNHYRASRLSKELIELANPQHPVKSFRDLIRRPK